MQSANNEQRKFVSVDPSKCTGCGLCEYSCTMEKGEKVWNPTLSRIRVVRMKPVLNFALSCRFCDDARCVKACPEKAIMQAEGTGILVIDEAKCKGCDWCVQACEHGGITIHPETGKAIACNLCGGEPKCIENCPEEALTLVSTDEEADKRFNDALTNMPEQIAKLETIVKNKDWKPLLAEAEKRSMKISENLEKMNRKKKEEAEKSE
ncbi:MAG: 4Fe-4S dicluster domain-containing protein [Candidatus Bathyarchaeota archaeon]|nr:4Fe-4S dicluster domain-containing protein [Candidatus Bathyarchaeota archaeon]